MCEYNQLEHTLCTTHTCKDADAYRGEREEHESSTHWLPLVWGPALAMESSPGRSCFSVKPSSSNFSPYMLSPPLHSAPDKLALYKEHCLASN